MAVRVARKLDEMSRAINNLDRETHDLIVLLNGLNIMENDVYELARKQIHSKKVMVDDLIHKLTELQKKMDLPVRSTAPKPVLPPIKTPVLVEHTPKSQEVKKEVPKTKLEKIRVNAPKTRASRR